MSTHPSVLECNVPQKKAVDIHALIASLHCVGAWQYSVHAAEMLADQHYSIAVLEARCRDLEEQLNDTPRPVDKQRIAQLEAALRRISEGGAPGITRDVLTPMETSVKRDAVFANTVSYPEPETICDHDWQCQRCGRIHRNASNNDICGCDRPPSALQAAQG